MQLGGPFWKVKLGRRDSKTGFFQLARSGVLPSPASSLSTLISRFKDQGLSAKDMVALSGIYVLFSIFIALISLSLRDTICIIANIIGPFKPTLYDTDKKKFLYLYSIFTRLIRRKKNVNNINI